MENNIEKLCEQIEALPNGVHMRKWDLYLEGTTDDLKLLATELRKTKAAMAAAEECVGHYADKHLTWVYGCSPCDAVNHDMDCVENKYVAADSSTSQHGYNHAVKAQAEIARLKGE